LAHALSFTAAIERVECALDLCVIAAAPLERVIAQLGAKGVAIADGPCCAAARLRALVPCT
jgi:hypothetical protein